ncbi:uncharacterized protein LOC128728991 [Anopheles nili]|uniref:uncharacterized protein LOC128728991 n=1 Tax=Anopheles nili TaxID=185578 RepID=UPI00237B46B4|nr:uncharacterized protein LOC128728991 [Anopheles nili]
MISYQCPLKCVDGHALRNCPIFSGKDVQQRREIVASKQLCWNCLSAAHQAKACKSDYSCRTCHQRHHTLLHIPTPNSMVAMAVQNNRGMVFLETVLLYIVDGCGNGHEARALLDSGSMSNFISTALARKLLGTPRNKVNVSILGIGNSLQLIKGSIFATVESRNQRHASQLELLILDSPFMEIPTSPIDASSWKMPNLPLADPSCFVPGKIDIIIGGDTYWELHSGRKRSLGRVGWLVETPFGWVVAGNRSSGDSQRSQLCLLAANGVPSLESILERFWETETVGDDPVLSTEEDACEKHFVATTTRDASGRYVVCLPQNNNPSVVLGESKANADRRLLAVERRLRSNPEMKEEYSKFMKEYERLGHMKLLTEPVNDSCEHYYLPHHAVVKETSTTTKVRVVFDASCKTSSGFSLNDKLLVGPVIQDDLFTIIVRFRSHAIALSADVEKMYRQIRHDESDQRYLRIRYREDPAQPMQTYQLQTVTYGTASAPFLARRTLKQIAYDHRTLHPLAVNAVLNDFYVDDLLSGTEEISDAIEMRNQIAEMLNAAGFSLKKWASNAPESLAGISSEDLAVLSTHEWQDPQFVSTLGQCLKAGNPSANNKNATTQQLIAAVPPLSSNELHQAELQLCRLA